jgi:two-component system OmpR family sensor kinase
MFRGLNSRLLLSYILVILVCLTLVGLGLLLFVRTSPLWIRAGSQQLEEAERTTMQTLIQAGPLEELTQEQLQRVLTRVAEDEGVRALLLDVNGTVRFDTEGEWVGQDFPKMIPPPLPAPARLQGVFTSPDGRRWLHLSVILPDIGRRRHILVFTAPPTRLLLLVWFANNLLPPLVQAGAVALVLSVLLALLVSRSVAAPLRRVAHAAEAIAQGETSTRAPVSGPAEVQALARSFNTMADQVEASQQSQRDFVANVSHELKTPLTSIQGFSQALLDGTARAPEATARAARVIHEEAERMRRMVDGLLILARFDAGEMHMARDPVELDPLLRRCIEKLEPQAQVAEVALERDTPERLFVTGDADRLAQVFANLVDNAVAHTPAGGKVTVATRRLDERVVEVTVTDTGEGIPAESLSRIFERFYQVDKSRQRGQGVCPERSRRVGLGLAITREIVEAHGGTIAAESVVGLGSRFTVRLPAREGSTATTVVRRRQER